MPNKPTVPLAWLAISLAACTSRPLDADDDEFGGSTSASAPAEDESTDGPSADSGNADSEAGDDASDEGSSSGSPGEFDDCDEFPLVTLDQQIEAMLADLATIPPEDRRYTRYVSFADRLQVVDCLSELRSLRIAFSRMLNRLSWSPDVVNPIPIDDDQLVFRINLRDYHWSADSPVNPDGLDKWDVYVSASPYAFTPPGDRAEQLAGLVEHPVPFVSGLPFLHALSTSNDPNAVGYDAEDHLGLYGRMLGDFASLTDLERRLGIDLSHNRESQAIVRGTILATDSADQVRIVERHALAFDAGGLWWLSNDPEGATPTGGQVLFGLPNGMQAYFAHDAVGDRTERITDPIHGEMMTGVDCIACHQAGVEELEPLSASPSMADLLQAVDSDAARQRAAYEATDPGAFGEDIVQMIAAYEAPLDAEALAALFGIDTEALRDALPLLPAPFMVLSDEDGLVERSVVDRHVGDLACTLIAACPD